MLKYQIKPMQLGGYFSYKLKKENFTPYIWVSGNVHPWIKKKVHPTLKSLVLNTLNPDCEISVLN